MRAIGYARVSKADKERGSEPVSLDVQRTAIERAAEYNGWDLGAIYNDNGKTGSHTRRDGLQAALATLKAGDADMLVIAKLDRLSRNVIDFGQLLQKAEQQGWFVSVLDQKIDTTTAAGWFAATILAAVADYERRVISERTRDALAVIKAAGTPLGRPSEISPAVQRKVLRLHNQGVSASAIARRLTNAGIPTPTGKATWHHSVVVELIRRHPTPAM